ncbi:choice-of-anchor I family protein [Spirosoma utsteinense]|uniref:WD40 repeat protein n=1 Tax=Spirosoma utsteinense TaxID=2585773 RepID=A0ABR6W2F7_9BACT|nr:choice-of-anchor I family protein [Spirosoma utsteinense]MBC3784439.1 WD40 repeat protein [Spirosoma utsteinense]MBC3790760.1 WD40 repeat protein [Spirosoma utsteinense]
MLHLRGLLVTIGIPLLLNACITDHRDPALQQENPATFREIANVDLGGVASAEIAAYDPISKRVFVVNNESAAKVDVLDLTAYPAVTRLAPINVSALGGVANSVAVSGGKLAIALEATNKQANGSVLVFNTSTLALIQQVTVGALPDMVTFSPDGTYIMTANEGEPNATYTTDPIGSVSIINTTDGYSVRTLSFESFTASLPQLAAGGFRVYGPNASLAQDIEPEYVTMSPDSKKAWVTLQENNGIAEVDLVAGVIVRIYPLGTKDYSLPQHAIDPSDRDSKISLAPWPVKSFYLPDAIAHFTAAGGGYLITANEGDAREYTAFDEQVRVGSLTLDPAKFPNAASLKQTASLGRLRVTRTAGNTNGVYETLYGFGGRGFSIYSAATGERVYDSDKSLEERVIAANLYDDDRSDDKGVEAEGVTVGLINGKPIAFVGMERADAVAVYDVSDPKSPRFLQLFKTGDAPEGVLFVSAQHSPNGRSLLIVSSEEDGTVRMYQPDTL